MTKKMSYATAIEFACAVLDDHDDNEILVNEIDDHGVTHEVTVGEVIERLNTLRESLNKRNSGKAGKPTKTQIANAEIGEQIVAAMSVGVPYAIADIKGLVPALADATPQKVGPILRHLRDEGKVVETKVKGKSVYTLA